MLIVSVQTLRAVSRSVLCVCVLLLSNAAARGSVHLRWVSVRMFFRL